MKIKIFLDTNILMDVLMEDRPLTAVSNKVFQTVLSNKTEGVLVAQSFVDASYMYLRKNPGGYDKFRDFVAKLCNFFNIHYIDTFALNYACRQDSGDFEDDAMYYVARSSFCDVIVTSDKMFRERHQGEDPNIQIMTPEEFVAKITVS